MSIYISAILPAPQVSDRSVEAFLILIKLSDLIGVVDDSESVD